MPVRAAALPPAGGATTVVRSGDCHATLTPMPRPCETRVNESIFRVTPSSATANSVSVRSRTGRLVLVAHDHVDEIAVARAVNDAIRQRAAWSVRQTRAANARQENDRGDRQDRAAH